MSNDSPLRFPPLIETAERRKHIQSIYDELGMSRIASAVSTVPSNVKSTVNNLYSNVQSKINKKILIVFTVLFLLTFAGFYWMKPNFILKSEKTKLETKNNKQDQITKINIAAKRINYIKLAMLSLIVASVFTLLLYLLRNRISFVGTIMTETPLPYL